MRRIRVAISGLVLLTACSSTPPAEIRESLAAQARYTRLYVEYANALIEREGRAEKLSDGERHSREEMRGVGERLVRNAEALGEWGEGGGKEK